MGILLPNSSQQNKTSALRHHASKQSSLSVHRVALLVHPVTTAHLAQFRIATLRTLRLVAIQRASPRHSRGKEYAATTHCPRLIPKALAVISSGLRSLHSGTTPSRALSGLGTSHHSAVLRGMPQKACEERR